MATLLQIAGIVVISLGLGLIWLPLGVISLGIGGVLFGLALERSVNA